ncbi:ribosomal protein S5 domain 2-type protein [Mycena floridula]|nr:ribosomal protein S5 domain 2-type protein [Mycena floridula]
MTSTSISKSEKSYAQSGFLSDPPRRLDGRVLHEFRSIALETGVSPLANGSARLNLGKSLHDGGGGTEIMAASKLEVENVEDGGIDGGRIVCTVTCSPAAYPHLTLPVIDDLQQDLTQVLSQTLSHVSLHPKNLGILSQKKAWLLNLDVLVMSDAGNVYDAIFMAAKAALWDTKVPRTRSVEYKATKNPMQVKVSADMDVDQDTQSGFDTRQHNTSAADFELTDYWDEGEILDGRERWPVCVTLNVMPPIHYLDATVQEEASTTTRLLLVFSPSTKASPRPMVQAMRTLGPGELTIEQLGSLVKNGETYAQQITDALNVKLKAEDTRRNQKARERFAKR